MEQACMEGRVRLWAEASVNLSLSEYAVQEV